MVYAKSRDEHLSDLIAHWNIFEIKMFDTRDYGAMLILDPARNSRHERFSWQLYMRAAQSACNNRRVFLTEKGYIGIGPVA